MNQHLQQRLADFVAANSEALSTPGLVHVAVKHDAWCGMQHGRGVCICNPTVELSNEAAAVEAIGRMSRSQRRAAARESNRGGK
ncbi:MAG: hypothetical protein K2Y02_03695 [Burkholderiaceae bacterium]|nr:hypothetical protein [Burkholderiaceae bacterium]